MKVRALLEKLDRPMSAMMHLCIEHSRPRPEQGNAAHGAHVYSWTLYIKVACPKCVHEAVFADLTKLLIMSSTRLVLVLATELPMPCMPAGRVHNRLIFQSCAEGFILACEQRQSS